MASTKIDAAIYNIKINRGALWNPAIRLIWRSTGLPRDLSTAKAYAKAIIGDNWASGAVLFELTSEGGSPSILIDGPNGTVRPVLERATTRVMARVKGNWLLDIDIDGTGQDRRFIRGRMETSEDVR